MRGRSESKVNLTYTWELRKEGVKYLDSENTVTRSGLHISFRYCIFYVRIFSLLQWRESSLLSPYLEVKVLKTVYTEVMNEKILQKGEGTPRTILHVRPSHPDLNHPDSKT